MTTEEMVAQALAQQNQVNQQLQQQLNDIMVKIPAGAPPQISTAPPTAPVAPTPLTAEQAYEAELDKVKKATTIRRARLELERSPAIAELVRAGNGYAVHANGWRVLGYVATGAAVVVAFGLLWLVGREGVKLLGRYLGA